LGIFLNLKDNSVLYVSVYNVLFDIKKSKSILGQLDTMAKCTLCLCATVWPLFPMGQRLQFCHRMLSSLLSVVYGTPAYTTNSEICRTQQW